MSVDKRFVLVLYSFSETLSVLHVYVNRGVI